MINNSPLRLRMAALGTSRWRSHIQKYTVAPGATEHFVNLDPSVGIMGLEQWGVSALMSVRQSSRLLCALDEDL